MNHDYFALKIHEARFHDLRSEAQRERVVHEVLRGRRALARLTTLASVRPLRSGGRDESGLPEGRDAA
jgi:hypothetical protein